jgi:hypothetical protein
VAYINVSAQSDFATLHISTSSVTISGTTANTSTSVLEVPALQNITLNNGNGVFRWKSLDSTSESAVAIPATNQISLNAVVDPNSFFGVTGAAGSANAKGLYALSNEKTKINFRMYFNGVDSGSKYVSGTGYITGLAPTVSPDQPVWVTPLTIEVDGDLSAIQTVA